jgi:signal transduction histidine kinase/ligand-binding sensor domain-containing protein/CheY-like chemotaxis protein
MNKKIFIFILLIIPLSLFSQIEKINFENVSEQKNLYHYLIRAIIQDKTGFLWVGTRSGISIFDSYKFYTLEGENKTLTSDVVKCLLADIYGDVWIGTPDGLNKYIRKQKITKHYIFDKNDINSICGNDIIGMAEDKFGNLWIATLNGLARYDKETDKFINYFHDKNNKKTLQSDRLSAIYIDKYDNLIVGYEGLGLDIINISENPAVNNNFKQTNLPIRHFAVGDTGNLDQTITKILRDKAGLIWIATNSIGLLSFNYNDQPDNPDLNITRIKSTIYCSDDPKFHISYDNISDIVEDRYGNLFIGTFGGGLNILDKTRTRLSIYTFNPDKHYSISDNYIKSMCIDSSGNVWIGGYAGGLDKYSPYKYKFNIYRSHPGDPTTLRNNHITAIYKDSDGILWVGTRDGLNEFDGIHPCKNHVYISTDIKYASSNRILSISPDKSNNLWLGTYAGLNCFDTKKKVFKDYNSNFQNRLKKTIIRAITLDNENNLWVGTQHGLFRYNLTSDEYILYPPNPSDPKGLSNNYVWAITNDKYNNLWVGTSYGLNLYNREKNNFTQYIYKAEKDPLTGKINPKDNLITCICQDHKNVIWIGTYSSGLHKIEPVYKDNTGIPNYENSIVSHSEPPIFVKECLNAIIEDNNNNLWVCSDKGITRIGPDRKTTRIYDTKDGLSPNEFNTASFLNYNGEFFFGGLNGMISFFPSKMKENEFIPNIVLTSFRIHNKEIYNGVEAAEMKKIELSSTQNEFSFTFAALDFTETSNNQYKYKLEGLDTNWIDCGNRNEASFMNLDGGEYTFRVIGSNNDRKWNLNGLNIKIIVHPAFWITAWFRLLVIAFIFCGIFLFFRLRTKKHEKQKEILKSMVDERTKELTVKTQQLDEINQIISVQNTELMTLNDNLSDKNRFIENQNEELILLKNDLEIKAAQAEIANKSKSEFLANMSHEIRTPMNAILGFTEILSSKIKDPELKNYTGIISSSGNALLTIINDILDLSKIEAGKLELQPSYINIRKIINDIKLLFIPKAKEKGLNFSAEISNDFPQNIFLDEVRIRQVIMNLVGNAIKFTNEGFIKINVNANSFPDKRTNQQDNGNNFFLISNIKITVEDSGIGIPKEQIEKIFKPFEQADGQSTRKFGGTGLGLSISTRLIRMMGGNLSVSVKNGKGSIFTIDIPEVKSNNDIEISTEQIDNRELNVEFLPARIMVIDDIAVNRDLVKAYLEDYNLNIVKIESGEKALQEIKKEKYDLILLDRKMPGLSGEEVAKILKSDELTKNIPIIMFTASALKEEAEQLLKISDCFLTKPVNRLKLIVEIKKFLPFNEKEEVQSAEKEEESFIEKVLSEEEKKELSGILRKECYQEWENLRKTRAMGNSKIFALKLQNLADLYGQIELKKYSGELLESVNMFKVLKTKSLLNEFPDIINKINN